MRHGKRSRARSGASASSNGATAFATFATALAAPPRPACPACPPPTRWRPRSADDGLGCRRATGLRRSSLFRNRSQLRKARKRCLRALVICGVSRRRPRASFAKPASLPAAARARPLRFDTVGTCARIEKKLGTAAEPDCPRRGGLGMWFTKPITRCAAISPADRARLRGQVGRKPIPVWSIIFRCCWPASFTWTPPNGCKAAPVAPWSKWPTCCWKPQRCQRAHLPRGASPHRGTSPLFWTGVYPESLQRCVRFSRKDHFSRLLRTGQTLLLDRQHLCERPYAEESARCCGGSANNSERYVPGDCARCARNGNRTPNCSLSRRSTGASSA